MSDLLHIIDFTPWLNHEFQIRFTQEVTMPAELVRITEINSYSPVDRKPFSLIFRTDQKTQYFQQAVCILHHPVKGEIPLFLVPLGPNENGMQYEAVFA